MLLSEMKPSENKSILLVGPPGSGKTCFAIGCPYPMLVLDFDAKVDSAAAWYASDNDRLKNVEVRDMSRKLDGRDPIAELNKIITDELIPQQNAGQMKYKTLVIDSVTTFSSAVLQHIVKTNPGIKRVACAQGVQPCQQDFGILKREFAKLIPGLLTLPMNIVMNAHMKADRSELTGEILRSPVMDGSFGQELPVFFKEVYRTFMKDGKPFAQTRSDLDYNFLRTQIPGMPPVIELSYANLVKQYKN